MNRSVPMLAAAIASLSCLLLVACAPQTAAERAYFEQKQAERDARDALRTTLTETSLKDADIVNLVVSNAAPDSNGINDDWLKRQIGQVEGQILFPRWKVLRQGANKYDVQYSFSVIDGQNRLTKRGYQWNVDVMVKLVSVPREMDFPATASAALPVTSQERRKARDQGFGLE